MTATGFWQTGIGLPKIDVGAMLAENSGHSWAWGNAMHFLNGIVLALIYAGWLYRVLPGGWLGRGLIYGAVTYLAASAVIVPLVSPAGFFLSKTPMPVIMNLASLIIHIAYGVALAVVYVPEGPRSSRQ